MTIEKAIEILSLYDVNFYYISGEREGEKVPANELMDAFEMAIGALREKAGLQGGPDCAWR